MTGQTNPVPAAERLLAGERDALLVELQRGHRRALEDNPEGCGLLAAAIEQALRFGFHAQCELEGVDPSEVEARTDTHDRWRHERDATPESRYWPEALAERAPEATDAAGDLLVSAGAELGFRERERRDLRWIGSQCAEAGAALARVLSHPEHEETPAVEAEPAKLGPLEADGSVRVALAANQAECELLQGRLSSAGIPSNWRRAGGDLPYLQSGGYREIYVPAIAAPDAQALLATVALPVAPDEQPSRAVGLEHTSIRLLGKATAVIMLLGFAFAAFVFLPSNASAAALAGFFVLAAVVVACSERASVRQQRHR